MPRRTAQIGLGSTQTKKTRNRTSQIEEDYLGTIRMLGVPEPEREYKFDPIRRWRFDFAWTKWPRSNRFAVEIEGGTWAKGRHTTGKGFEADCRKYNAANMSGWRVLRFTSSMVRSWEAARVTKEALGL